MNSQIKNIQLKIFIAVINLCNDRDKIEPLRKGGRNFEY